MKTFLLAVSAAGLGLTWAGAAQAQEVGNPIGGQVGGQLQSSAQATPASPIVADADSVARDSADGARDGVLQSDPQAAVGADARANVEMRGGEGSWANVRVGTMVHGSDGGMLGEVSGVTRDSAGRVIGFVMRTADGATRTVPAANASVQGGAVVMTRAQ